MSAPQESEYSPSLPGVPVDPSLAPCPFCNAPPFRFVVDGAVVAHCRSPRCVSVDIPADIWNTRPAPSLKETAILPRVEAHTAMFEVRQALHAEGHGESRIDMIMDAFISRGWHPAQAPAPLEAGWDGELGDTLKKILALSHKHEVQYWLDAPGTDAEKLAKITGLVWDAQEQAATLRQEVESLKSENFLLQRKLDIALDEYEKRVGERDAMRKELDATRSALEGFWNKGWTREALEAAKLVLFPETAALAHPVSAPTNEAKNGN